MTSFLEAYSTSSGEATKSKYCCLSHWIICCKILVFFVASIRLKWIVQLSETDQCWTCSLFTFTSFEIYELFKIRLEETFFKFKKLLVINHFFGASNAAILRRSISDQTYDFVEAADVCPRITAISWVPDSKRFVARLSEWRPWCFPLVSTPASLKYGKILSSKWSFLLTFLFCICISVFGWSAITLWRFS